jgi:Ni/Co efflux regulator RcnB
MKRIALQTSALALLVAGILAAAPALADKPSWAGGGKGGKHEQEDRQDNQRDQERSRDRRHFDDRQRVVVHEYYAGEFHRGRCPPGLAKKHNGCTPPGHAKQWEVGRPLPREVIYHEVPRQVVMQIGPPPSGHRYVRVASDILLIALGTGMVVDSINDLGRI